MALSPTAMLAVAEHEVAEGKTQRTAGRFIGRRLQAREDVVNVITALTQMGERQRQAIDLDGAGNRCKAQERLHFCIYIETCNFQLGLPWEKQAAFRPRSRRRRAAGFGDGQITEGQLQRPRTEVHRAHRELPAQLLRNRFSSCDFSTTGTGI